MIFNYPYFGFPPYYRKYYPKNINVVPVSQTMQSQKSICNSYNDSSKKSHIVSANCSTTHNDERNNNIQKKISSCSFEEQENNEECIKKYEYKETEQPLFELFGMKLYFDDILLLGLLFVLYSEGSDDTNLYIALILLLIS